MALLGLSLSLNAFAQTIQSKSFHFTGKLRGKKIDSTFVEEIKVIIINTKVTMLSKSIGKITFCGVERENAYNGLIIYGRKNADGSFYDYAEIDGNEKCERSFICSCSIGDISIECY